jgi:Cytolethal distending toxin A/C domain
MRRTLIVLLGAVMAGLLGASPAMANSEVVRIADPTLANNVTAITQLNNVFLQPARSTDMQRWRIDRSLTGVVRIINVATGGCLSVFNRLGPMDGMVALQEYCIDGWILQQWQVINGVDGTVRLRNVGFERCLTVDINSPSHGPYVAVYTCGTHLRQDFRLVR